MSSYFNNNFLFDSVQSIPGVGPKTYHILEKKIGKRIIDLLFYIPYKSLNRFENQLIKDASPGDLITVEVEVIEINIKNNFYKKNVPTKIITLGINKNHNHRLDIVYFNLYKNSIQNIFKVGSKLIISGKLEVYNGICQISHPDYIVPIHKKENIPVVDPIYKLFYGIKKKNLVKYIQNSLLHLTKTDEFKNFPEWISNKTIKKLSIISLKDTLTRIHNPMHEDDNSPDSFLLRRLAFDELLNNYISLKILKNKIKSKNSNIPKSNDKKINKFIKNLPFKLTPDQIKSLNQINIDLEQNKPMMRLLQGDVGCGKTIVALCAMLKVISFGHQAVLMVPTEVLAKQHYETIISFLKDMKFTPSLILGQKRTKKNLLNNQLKKIKDGTAKLIIGTHALISKNIEYKSLKLAIIDEQHKFGVNQRIAIAEKGKDVNLLVMTATPIPRSLALTSYGDMSISNLRSKPKGRQKIETSMISSQKTNQLLSGLNRKILDGSLVYWICPAIEENDEHDLVSINERYKKLIKVFPTISISMAHGKQDVYERNLSIEKFKNGESKILLSTTVVEVGVDIPEADIIVIECANRYGLAQLHQLRGRVGRGIKKSNCILLYENNLSYIAEQRLKTLKYNHDGFKIAEEDLILRGSGEILGTKQSGDNTFKFVNFKFHSNLIDIAKIESEIIYNDKYKDGIKALLKIYQNKKFLKNLGG